MGEGVSVGPGVMVGQGVSVDAGVRVGHGVSVGQGVSADHGDKVGHWDVSGLAVWLGDADEEFDGVETLEPVQAPAMAATKSIAAAPGAPLRLHAAICGPGLPDPRHDIDDKLANMSHLPGGSP